MRRWRRASSRNLASSATPNKQRSRGQGMDSETDALLKTVARAHDLLVVQVLGMMALLGAMTEVVRPDPERVAIWCDLVTRGQAGISQANVQSAADAILNYVRANGTPRSLPE